MLSVASPEIKLTPMMEQWHQAKRKHPDAILLFRMGDFYELFGEDAILSAPILELALTCRDKDKNGLKMAGFPFHSAPAYINKLVEQGHKVAICEQLEDPKATKGIVKRGVVEVISPGTLIENEDSASNTTHSFLVSVFRENGAWALCALDISVGTYIATSSNDESKIAEEIIRLHPKEIVVNKDDERAIEFLCALQKNYPSLIWRLEKKILRTKSGGQIVDQAQELLMVYIRELIGALPSHISVPIYYSIDDRLLMDESTRENLDLLPKKKGQQQNLFSVLNYLKTPMAKRQLLEELSAPSTSLSEIEQRQRRVGEFISDERMLHQIREELSACYDLSRLTALTASNKIGPRGLGRLRDCLGIVERIRELLEKSPSEEFSSLARQIPKLSEERAELERALHYSLPLTLKDGDIFQPGYDEKLDEYQQLCNNGQELLLAIEQREKASTGISSLKIKYTRVFGYYLEITKTHLDKVPAHYQRKQTIANGERYATAELNELEYRLNSAQEQKAVREAELFEALRSMITQKAQALIQIATMLSEIDILSSFAEAARLNNWTKPILLAKEEALIAIEGGRHPIIEALLAKNGALFVPNDLTLDSKNKIVALVTGPNMAGKSTIMRQMALIQIMAQIGSFVPARSARLSICDQIFARVGASDDLARGRSTFMVEMSETSHILRQASHYSLILLDEIGRGTSTYDGMAIAQSVLEYLHHEVKARTLFATHYHELTELEKDLAQLKNYHVEVEEKNNQVRFLYTLAEGPALQSFGIQVARLAGLPTSVLNRASTILSTLEAKPHKNSIEIKQDNQAKQPGLFVQATPNLSPEIESLAKLDINRMTPLQAMLKLHGLQNSIRQAIKID